MIGFQVILFIYMAAGIIAGKTRVLNDKGAAGLSSLLINIVLPCMIFGAFTNKETSGMWAEMGTIILCAIFGQALCVGCSFIFFRKVPDGKREILRYGTMTSNFSFLGLPSCQEYYGAEGYLLASVTQIVYRVITWTLGVRTVAKGNDEESGSPALKLVKHPCMIALYLGIIYMLLPFDAPSFIISGIKGLGSCSTPLCMIYVGYVMANVKWNVKDIGILAFYSVLRLILMPAAVFIVLYLLRLEPIVIAVTVLQTAMPAPSTSAVFAGKYGKDAGFAGQMVFMSTALSLLTVPAVVSIINSLLF